MCFFPSGVKAKLLACLCEVNSIVTATTLQNLICNISDVICLIRMQWSLCLQANEIIYPFLNFNRCTVEVGKWKKFHPILYLTCDYLSMLGLKSIHVSSKRGRNRHFKGRKVGLISTNLFLIIDEFVLYSLSWRRHTKWRTGCGDFLRYLQYHFLG